MASTRFFRAQGRILGRLPESGTSDRVRRTSDLVRVAPVAAAVDHQGNEFRSASASIVFANLGKSLVLTRGRDPHSSAINVDTLRAWVPAGETQGWPSAGGSCGHSGIED